MAGTRQFHQGGSFVLGDDRVDAVKGVELAVLSQARFRQHIHNASVGQQHCARQIDVVAAVVLLQRGKQRFVNALLPAANRWDFPHFPCGDDRDVGFGNGCGNSVLLLLHIELLLVPDHRSPWNGLVEQLYDIRSIYLSFFPQGKTKRRNGRFIFLRMLLFGKAAQFREAERGIVRTVVWILDRQFRVVVHTFSMRMTRFPTRDRALCDDNRNAALPR